MIKSENQEFVERIQKFEGEYDELKKLEPELAARAERAKKRAIATGDPQAVEDHKALMGEILKDRMIQGMGNHIAWKSFVQQNPNKTHIHIDANDFGKINKLYGFPEGDAAIKRIGEAMHRALKSTVGRGGGKLFRRGGDEFSAIFDRPEHAHHFARAFRAELEGLVPAGGTHEHSVSMGFGENPDQAEQALIHAKNAKKAGGHPEGQAPSYAHSLLPQSTGPVAVHEPATLRPGYTGPERRVTDRRKP